MFWDLDPSEERAEMSGSARMIGALLAVLVEACGGSAGNTKPGSATTRDSAGVRIVDNAGPAWGADTRWTVGDSLLVDIGGKTGNPAYEVDQVRGPAPAPRTARAPPGVPTRAGPSATAFWWILAARPAILPMKSIRSGGRCG